MTQTKFKKTEIGLIPEDWKVGKINDLCEIIGGFAIKSKDFIEEGIPVIKIKNINQNGSVNPDDIQFISVELFNKLKECYKLKANDFVIAMTGATIGKIGKVPSKYKKYVLNQRVATIVSNNEWDKKYIFQIFRSKIVQINVINNANGAAQANISSDGIGTIRIPIPNKSERKAIAKILSDLDSKIDLLQKQNKNLEKIGQSIFKRWFVDFEFPNEEGNPYKTSGGKMVESELGEIPEGWMMDKLGNYIDSISGCSYTSKGLEESEEALVTLKSIGVKGFKQEGFKEYTGDYKDKHVVKDGDIVVAHTDLTQNRVILGKPAIVRDLGKYKKMIASMDLSIVKPIKLINRPFLFYLLNTRLFHGYADGYANGTTVIHLSRKAIPEFSFVVPDENILLKFKNIINDFFDKIRVNQIEIAFLKKTRNLLLPKLMSGKIRVK